MLKRDELTIARGGVKVPLAASGFLAVVTYTCNGSQWSVSRETYGSERLPELGGKNHVHCLPIIEHEPDTYSGLRVI